MSKPALRVEPLIRLLGEFRDTPLLKKLRRDALCRRFIGNMLRAVFTKLKM
jgi:hypothetical protein